MIKIAAGIVGVALLVWLIWLFIKVDHVTTMAVRSKEWYRVIKELEDYTTTDCSPTSDGKSITCTTSTHTRTINSWPTQGTYPQTPYWQADYTIGNGHYERRTENYVIRLSDDKAIWTYSVGNEGWYDTFPVRGNCLVGINWFNVILKVEC